jgi:predicted Fe-S protein YdhL (DUF1289 family)
MADIPPIRNPCVGVCDSLSNPFCTGCFRTTEEVLNWSRMLEAEKQLTLRVMSLRRAKAK